MADNFDHAITLSVKLEADDVKQTSQELQQKIQGVFSGMGDKASIPFLKLQASMSRAVSSAQRLQDSMEAMKTQPTAQFEALSQQLEKLQGQYQQTAKAVSQAQEDLAKGKAIDTTEYDNAKIKLEELNNKIKTVQASMQEMRTAGTAFEVPDNLKNTYATRAAQLGDVNNKMRILLETQNAMVRKEEEQAEASRKAAAAQEEATNAKQQAAKAQQVYNIAANIASGIVKKFIGTIRSMIGYIQKATVFVGQLAKKLLSVVGSAIQRGFERLAKSIRNVSHATESSNFNFKKALTVLIQYGIGVRSLYFLFRKLRTAITEGFENLVQFQDGTTSIAKSIEGLKNNLIYLKNAWAAAFAPLVEYVMPAVNAAIDRLADFAHTIGAIFANLTGKTTMIKAVKNMDGYADSADEAAENVEEATEEQKKLNRELFSWDELNRQQEEPQTKDKSKKVDDALQKANEANNMFEEVPVENMLPQWLLDWLDKLKQLWGDGKWFDIGKHIADIINKGLKYLDDWINNDFRPWIKEWVNRIIEIINGFIEGLDWKLLGKTIGDLVNTLVDVLYDFFTKVNWEKLGRNIGKALVSMLKTIDWKKVGATFAAKWNALIKFIYGLVTTPGIWKEIGLAIAGFINGWFDEVDFNKAARTLATAINGVFKTIRTVLKNTNIPEGFKKAAEAINLFFKSVDWKTNGETVAQVINTIVESFTQFFTTLDGEAAGQSLGEFLLAIFGNIDTDGVIALLESAWETIKGFFSELFETLDIDTDALLEKAPEIAKTLGEMVAEAANMILTSDAFHQVLIALGTFFVTVFSNIEWGEIKKRLLKDITEIFKNIDTQKLKDTLLGVLKTAVLLVVGEKALEGAVFAIGQFIVNKLVAFFTGSKVIAMLSGIGRLLIYHIVNGISTAFSTVFSASFWAPMTTAMGGSMLAAVAEALGTLTVGILTIIAGWNLGTLISEAFFGASEEDKSFLGFLQAIKDAFSDPELNLSISGFGSFLGEQLGNIYDNMLAMADKTQWIWDLFVNAAKDAFDFMTLGIFALFTSWDDIIASLQDVGSKIGEAWDGVKTSLSNTWDAIKTKASEVWNGIKETLSAIWNGLKEDATNTWNNIKEFVSGLWDGLKTKASEVWNGIKETVSAVWNGLKEDATAIWDGIKTSISGVWEDLKTTASSVWDDIKGAISLAIDDIKKYFDDLSDFWNGQIDSWTEFGRNIIDGIWNGLKEAWDGLKSWFDDAIGGLQMAAEDILQIGSPSKVFYQIGAFVDAGLANGIADESGSIIDEMDRVTNQLANTKIPAFKNIENMKLPAVATGSVVPAMATSYTSTSQSIDNSILDKLASILEEVVSNADNRGSGGNGGSQVISVNVSGREILNAVVEENNRALQRTGISPIRV